MYSSMIINMYVYKYMYDMCVIELNSESFPQYLVQKKSTKLSKLSPPGNQIKDVGNTFTTQDAICKESRTKPLHVSDWLPGCRGRFNKIHPPKFNSEWTPLKHGGCLEDGSGTGFLLGQTVPFQGQNVCLSGGVNMTNNRWINESHHFPRPGEFDVFMANQPTPTPYGYFGVV